MDQIMSVLDFAISIARFIIMLGVLVFVHELGHFVAAKFCNVYVVRFALGWGKRLFGFQIGETDYCVSMFPIGGYVKMVGQEDMPRTEEEALQAEPEFADLPPERRFNNLPASKKLIISFSGPLMNLLLGFPLFWLVFLVGIPLPISSLNTRVGEVVEGSPAELAGIRPGHRVLSINGAQINKWEQLQLAAMTNEDHSLDLELEDLEGKLTRVTVTPIREDGSTRAGIGIAPLEVNRIDHISPGMGADRSDLQKGDMVLTYNGRTPDNETFQKFIETVNMSGGQPMVFTVLRDGRVLDVTVIPEEVSVLKGVLFKNDIVTYVAPEPANKITSESGGEDVVVSEQTPRAASILKPGDVVTAVNGEPVAPDDKEFLAEKIYNLKGDKVDFTIERSSGLFGKPQSMVLSVPLTRQGMIGVHFSPFVVHKFGPGEAFVRTFGKYRDTFKLIMQTIYYLVAGKVSTRELAGPLGIAVITEYTLAMGGLTYYLNFVAMITINLAIVNLLPIPVLDGGMILITIIESIRRRPIEEKYLIIFQKIGVVFILLLLFVATYNDVLRAINYFMGGSFLE